MISKKKVTALALAGLFVTPVLAATEVDYNEIRSGDGYLRECLDFCVQGGFQGGSQSRLPFVL